MRKPTMGGSLVCCLAFWLGTIWASGVLGAESTPSDSAPPPFRLAFSRNMFADVNENDARAAMKVWIMTVAKERAIPVDPNPHICRNTGELIQHINTNRVDGFGLTTPEYARLSQETKFDQFAVGVRNECITEEYLLLVHRDSGLDRLEQLKGRSIHVLLSPRTSLAWIWLDTVLMEARLGCASNFFGRIALNRKTSQVALPAFFRQIDACLIPSSSLKVMGELNPQVEKQLRPLAASPPLIPSGFAFRADYSSSFRTQVLKEMSRLADSPSGRQILALTQADRIEARPISCLDTSLELLAKHHRLCEKANAAPQSETSSQTAEGHN